MVITVSIDGEINKIIFALKYVGIVKEKGTSSASVCRPLVTASRGCGGLWSTEDGPTICRVPGRARRLWKVLDCRRKRRQQDAKIVGTHR